MPFIFYKIELLLEYKNREFKRFYSKRGFLLQEIDEMFKLHALIVNTLTKVRRVMNKVIIGQELSGRHPTKDTLFDILSLANQLYWSWSTFSEGLELRKIYLSENPIPDLLAEGTKLFGAIVDDFNQSLEKNNVIATFNKAEDTLVEEENNPIDLKVGGNKKVNELFLEAQKSLSITTDLVDLYLWLCIVYYPTWPVFHLIEQDKSNKINWLSTFFEFFSSVYVTSHSF